MVSKIILGMSSGLPNFERPPVVEVVLTAQFAPLRGFSASHAGLYWRDHLDRNWTRAKDVRRIDDAEERFVEDSRVWREVRYVLADEPPRVQIVHADNEHMIQIQNSRFSLNWRKQGSDYPRYEALRPVFQSHWDGFRGFTAGAGLGEVSVNLWELMYVNRVPKGEIWESRRDSDQVIPRFRPPLDDTPEMSCEGLFKDEWAYALRDRAGRLYITTTFGWLPTTGEFLNLQLLARGAVDSHRTLEQGFELGHAAIVNAFTAMTSEAAHHHWRRTS
jgi:uncharacterized protein (TIGR04255 family)